MKVFLKAVLSATIIVLVASCASQYEQSDTVIAESPAAEPVVITGSRLQAQASVPPPQKSAESLMLEQVKPINPDYQRQIKENPVFQTSEEPLSTFSIDVDDGSYNLYQKQLNQLARSANGLEYLSQIETTIRSEEFINHFDYDYPQPQDNKPFSVNFEMMASPWNENNQLLKIGIQGKTANFESLNPINLVFLVDSSGSMSEELGLVKLSLKTLVSKLRPQDRISLISYAGHTQVYLESTPATQKNKKEINRVIDSIRSNGSTNGESAIITAYRLAEKYHTEEVLSRVILMSDGDFNVGQTDAGSLEEMIKRKRESGVTFSTIGYDFDGYYNDHGMEKFSNVGNGSYYFVSDNKDVKRNFNDRFAASLVNIAKDVKIQVEFNPSQISEYRLIGYENRKLEHQDFNNDKKDAGEITSGTNATAIYEVTLTGDKGLLDPSRYQLPQSGFGDVSNELAYVKIRYKQPGGSLSQLLAFPLTYEIAKSEASEDMQFAAAVAGFAQLIRRSDYIGDYTYQQALDTISKCKGQDTSGIRQDFAEMVGFRQMLGQQNGEKAAIVTENSK